MFHGRLRGLYRTPSVPGDPIAGRSARRICLNACSSRSAAASRSFPTPLVSELFLKPMFGALIRAAERWCAVKVTEFERRQMTRARPAARRRHAHDDGPTIVQKRESLLHRKSQSPRVLIAKTLSKLSSVVSASGCPSRCKHRYAGSSGRLRSSTMPIKPSGCCAISPAASIGNRRNPPPRAENGANFFRSSARARGGDLR